jgi:hypothetical protein
MKLDTSVAPEIALLAGGLRAAAPRAAAPSAARPSGPAGSAVPAGAGPGGPAPAVPPTIGYLAACLRLLVADPQSWWDLVRFDPGRPLQAAVTPPAPGCEAWLLVLPPGYRGDGRQAEQGGQVACLVAGEVTEQAGSPPGLRGHPLRPGRIRVRGGDGPRTMTNAGSGYAVSLHVRAVAR